MNNVYLTQMPQAWCPLFEWNYNKYLNVGLWNSNGFLSTKRISRSEQTCVVLVCQTRELADRMSEKL